MDVRGTHDKPTADRSSQLASSLDAAPDHEDRAGAAAGGR